MSIGKSQAAALADGFVNSLGEGKEGLQPRNTLTELFKIVGEFVEDMQANLNKTNSNASGKLSGTLTIDEPRQAGSTVRVDILMNYYGKFLNKGVKGVGENKAGNALYSFKSPFPSKGMVKALEAGIATAKKSTTNVNAKKSTSANEKKNSQTAESRAYGAGVNIKRYGIKPTGFIDKAIVAAIPKIRSRLGAALKVDIIDSITIP